MQPHYPPEQQPALTVSDEINLIELVWFVWDSKITIITSALMCFAAAFGYMLNTPKTYTSNTLLIPPSSFEVNRYMNLSSITGIEINAEELMSSYRQIWLRPGVIEDSLVSSGLINQSDFQSEKDFEEEVALMAASVTLEKVATSDKDLSANPDLATHWQIIFETSQPDAWLKALKLIDRKATLATKEDFIQEYETWSKVEATKRDFAIEDIQTQKANAKRDFDKEMEKFELRLEFEIQDTQTQIENAIADYERTTTDRLAFLYEQASIARTLGVAKNTIEAQTFGAQTGIVANVKTDTPFYLRGYEAIEKEIELIEGRKNKAPFINGLIDLERKLRELEQDRTLERVAKNKLYLESLIELEKKERLLEQDKKVERALELVEESPLANPEAFKAAQISIEATKFKSNSKNSLLFAVSFVAGGFIGIFVAALKVAFRRRKTLETAGA